MADDSGDGAIRGAQSEEVRVVDNPDARRYEIAVDGEVAFLSYRRKRDKIALVHTEVPASLRGRGLAGLLAKTALEVARVEGLRVVVLCKYVKAYIDEHPEYRALVARATDAPADESP